MNSSLPKELQKLLSGARPKHVSSGQIVLYEGDPVDYALIIRSGVMCMYDIDNDGNRKILHLAGAPSVVPFAFFKGYKSYLYWFYEALTDVEVYVLPAQDMRDAMSRDPDLNRVVVGTFAENVHELLVRLSSMNKTNVQIKLVAVLKFLVLCYAQKRRGEWFRVEFPVSHQLLADMCGITRESASLGLKELQESKVIRYPKSNILEVNKNTLHSL